jgi:hypothetical protein
MMREENHVTRRVMNMNIEGCRSRGRSKQRRIDCVRQDMREISVSGEITSDRGEWWKRTCCADSQ